MTKDEFIHNLRGIDDGQSIDRSYLALIYDSILANPIVMTVQSSESAAGNTTAPTAPKENRRHSLMWGSISANTANGTTGTTNRDNSVGSSTTANSIITSSVTSAFSPHSSNLPEEIPIDETGNHSLPDY